MPLTEDFQNEIASAVDTTVSEQTARAEAEAPAEGEMPFGGNIEGESKTEEKPNDDDGTPNPEKDPGSGKPVDESDSAVQARADDDSTSDKNVGGNGDKGSAGDSETDDQGGAGGEGTTGVSSQVIAEALSVGITVSEAQSLGDDKTVMEIVNRVHEDRLADLEAEAEAREQVAAESKDDPTDPLAGFPELDPEKFDPEVLASIEAMKAIVTKQQEQINDFESRDQQHSEAADSANAAAVKTWFDGQIAGLGEEFEKSLGKGDIDSLDKTGGEYINRDQIAQQMSILLNGYQASGVDAPPKNEVFETAARQVLREEFAARDEAALAKKVEQRSAQEISRAGGKKIKQGGSPQDETAAILNERFFGGS